MPEGDYARKWIDGTASDKNKEMYNFYARFASRKPMAISESGVHFIHSLNTTLSEMDIKRTWWEQVYNVPGYFPNIKALVNFDEQKKDFGSVEKDWRIVTSSNVQIREGFSSFVGSRKEKLWFGDEIEVMCNGEFRRG
jgi:hypothetical protein